MKQYLWINNFFVIHSSLSILDVLFEPHTNFHNGIEHTFREKDLDSLIGSTPGESNIKLAMSKHWCLTDWGDGG